MNKYQEALNELASYYDYGDYPKILQELVDKATPRKVTSEMLWVNIYKHNCPLCEEKVDKTDYYCRYCGQALDWSNELKESTK